MSEPLQEFPTSREERRAELEAARACLLEEIERARQVSGQADSNAADRWSLPQLAYHLQLAERFTARALQKTLASGDRVQPASDERLREEWERIRHVVGARPTKAQSPARVVPDGAPDIDQVLALLGESRQAFLQVLEGASDKDLTSILLPHPFPAVGVLIGISWTSVTAFHELRHCAQIREMIAGSPNQPTPSNP